MTAGPGARHFGMDWLRIVAFVLLILYHIGFLFTPWGYQTPTRGVVDGMAVVLLALNPWRLSLLFAISGYASAAMLGKGVGTGDFLKGRVARLAIPLLFGMAVMVPPQEWIGAMRDHGYAGSFARYLIEDYDPFVAVGGVPLPKWIHLWFVAYLLAYTLVLCGIVWGLSGGQRASLRGLFEGALAGPLLLVLPTLWIYLVRLLPGDWTDTHDLVTDGVAHLAYLPMFLFGVLLRGSPRLHGAIARQWKLAALCALAAYAIVFWIKTVYPNEVVVPPRLDALFLAARAVQGWCSVVALFGFADRYWNRDGPLRATLAEAVFPFYIAHQAIYVLVGYWIGDMGLGALAEFTVLLAATALGCIAFYIIGREIVPLRPLIGLRPERRGRLPEAEPLAA